MTELKPCPFCGGKAVMWRTTWDVFIECEHYSTEEHRVMMQAPTEQKAAALWNERAGEKNAD